MRHSKGATKESLLGKKEEMEWNNADNNVFYEAVKAEELKAIAEKGGLASGCDLEQLTPYWSKANSILEVGAGYGRVLDYLLKHQFQGKITAIEQSNTLFSYLERKYRANERVHLLRENISNIDNIQNHFDVIFYMWSGIADFSQKEQPRIINKLARRLNKKGQLIIDTIPMDVMPLNATKFGEQLYSFRINSSIKYIYEPNTDEIKKYAQDAGLSLIELITVKTDIGRERWLYILS